MIWYDSDMIWWNMISINIVCVVHVHRCQRFLMQMPPAYFSHITHAQSNLLQSQLTPPSNSNNNWVCNCGLDPDQNFANETKPLCRIMLVRHFIRQSWVGSVKKHIGIIQKYGIIILLKKYGHHPPEDWHIIEPEKCSPLEKNTRNIPNSNHRLLDSSR